MKKKIFSCNVHGEIQFEYSNKIQEAQKAHMESGESFVKYFQDESIAYRRPYFDIDNLHRYVCDRIDNQKEFFENHPF